MVRIQAAIALLHGGDRAGARAAFERIWSEIHADPDPLHACTLCHFMADAQDDVAAELEWDLRALAAAERVSRERARDHHPSLSIQSFFPSLHLNLGDDYLRLGDLDNAARHAAAAQAVLADLPETELGGMIRGGIERLVSRLSEGKEGTS